MPSADGDRILRRFRRADLVERRLAPQYRMTVAEHDLELIQQAAPRAAGDMRSEYHVSQGGEAVARGPRLHGVRIEARAGDRVCFQRLVQRVLVDQPAAAGIDEKGAGSHGGKERTIGESRVLWDVGDVQRHEVRAAKQVAKLDEPRPGGRFLLRCRAAALGIEDSHPEGAGKPRCQKPYFSHSDDTERLAVEPLASIPAQL